MTYSLTQNVSKEGFNEFLQVGALLSQGGDDVWMGWQGREWSAHPSESHPSFFLPDFFLTRPQPWLGFQQWARVNRKVLLEFLSEKVHPPLHLKWQEPDRDQFLADFQKIQTEFQRGTLVKAVPVVFATAEARITAAQRAFLLQRLLQQAQGRFVYGFWENEEGLLGLTPELLCQVEGRRLKTMALAGTSSIENEADWENDPKEHREHQLVVEDLSSQLEIWGEAVIEPTRKWLLGPIIHWRTDLEVQANRDLDLAATSLWLHPTPALGVAPRRFPWRWLTQLPGALDRGRFGAPFGLRFPGGGGWSVVAIRNLQWSEGVLQLGSGCGLVQESVWEKEWNELKLKRASVKEILAL